MLSDVLLDLSLRGEVYCRTRLGRDLALSFPPDQAHFHVIERGPCWVKVPGEARTFIAGTGDLVLLLAASGHTVASTESPGNDYGLWDAVADHYDAQRLLLDLSHDEPQVDMICGRFSMDAISSEGLVSALPKVLHVPSQGGAYGDQLALLLQLLSREASADLPGADLARSRLVDLVLVSAIRRWLQIHSSEQISWLTALNDPTVGAALRLLHSEPTHPWTVPALASAVGLSRSPFAARFKAQVGMSPMRYLTARRMRLALRRLQRGHTVGEVARAVGYRSEAAFSRVFKKEMGRPPSAFRRPDDSTERAPAP